VKPPEDDDETTSMNEEAAPPAEPASIEEPAFVRYSATDFEAMLGGFTDVALHVVLGGGDDDDDHRPRARVGRYERRDP
jgi:hypothetical protein